MACAKERRKAPKKSGGVGAKAAGVVRVLTNDNGRYLRDFADVLVGLDDALYAGDGEFGLYFYAF